MYPTVYLVSPLGCLIGVSHLTCSSSWTSPLFKKFLYSQSSSFQMILIPNFQLFRQKTCVHPWYLFLSHITIQTISKFHRIYFQNISTIQSLLPTTTDRTEASPSLAWITVGCPCWSLPQICSLFLVQETKRYIKNISWVISLFSSKPSNGFLLTQSKIQVLTRMYKKPYTIWSLSLWSHLLLPPLPSFTLCRHTGLFATLPGQKFFCLRAWAHTIPLTEDFFLPRHLQVTPSPTSGIYKHLFFTLLFQTQPNLHLNSLSSFPALFFSIELPVIKWRTIYWLILLLIFFRLEYTPWKQAFCPLTD